MKRILILAIGLLGYFGHAQIGIGNTDPKSTLDISATSAGTPTNTDGILIPRIHNFPATDPTADQDGMMVFVTGSGTPAKGFYYWDNATTSWVVVNGDSSRWSLSGNSGTNPSSNFIGTTDNQELSIRVNNSEKFRVTARGQLESFNTGNSVYIGESAGDNYDISMGGTHSVGIGRNALRALVDGNGNTALGSNSLSNTTSGYQNTATGYFSMNLNTTGRDNTANGNFSLYNNTNGTFNVAVGSNAMNQNTSGNNNVAVGYLAMRENTNGNSSVAMGTAAGFSNTSGSLNVFLGHNAGYFEPGSNKLYIENSTADANNALIYGEFNSNILRVNGELQVSNPSGTGYALPTADGSSGQVLTTDGSGQVSFSSPVSGEWTDLGSYIAPADGDAESVLIGTTTGGTAKLGVTTGVGAANSGIEVDFSGAADHGIRTELTSGNGLKYGVYNNIGGDNGNFGSTGTHNNVTTAGNGSRIATFNTVNSTGTGNKYATWNYIPVGDPGTHYGIYSDAQNASGYAGYFVGRMSLGTSAANRYLMPASDGTAGQVITTDGSGQLSFSTPSTGWALTGNSGTNSATNFIGTTDNQALSFRVNNSNKLLITNKGQLEIFNTASSVYLGELAGASYSITSAFNNVGVGHSALTANSSGVNNVAVGSRSMEANTTGYQNVGVGYFSLSDNTSGRDNTALGNFALAANTIGVTNVAIGASAMSFNTSGGGNVGIGFEALDSNTFGTGNIGLGLSAGFSNTTGDFNVFLGYNAGYNETGDHKLYIENTNADADNALIYGEFNNDILRTNGEFQISNPTGTGYAFPTADGSADQVLATDGSGQLSFVDAAANISNFALAKMRMSASQAIPASAWTKQSFSATVFDLGSNFDTGTDRFDVTEAGHYRVSASYRSTTNIAATNTYGIAIYINGTSASITSYNHHGSGGVHRVVDAVLSLSATDYVEIYAFGNSGFTISSDVRISSFEVERIR